MQLIRVQTLYKTIICKSLDMVCPAELPNKLKYKYVNMLTNVTFIPGFFYDISPLHLDLKLNPQTNTNNIDPRFKI